MPRDSSLSCNYRQEDFGWIVSIWCWCSGWSRCRCFCRCSGRGRCRCFCRCSGRSCRHICFPPEPALKLKRAAGCWRIGHSLTNAAAYPIRPACTCAAAAADDCPWQSDATCRHQYPNAQAGTQQQNDKQHRSPVMARFEQWVLLSAHFPASESALSCNFSAASCACSRA